MFTNILQVVEITRVILAVLFIGSLLYSFLTKRFNSILLIEIILAVLLLSTYVVSIIITERIFDIIMAGAYLLLVVSGTIIFIQQLKKKRHKPLEEKETNN